MPEPITHGCRVVAIKPGGMFAGLAFDHFFLDPKGQLASEVHLDFGCWSKSVRELRASGWELHVTYNPKSIQS